jgi:hypothetical protein
MTEQLILNKILQKCFKSCQSIINSKCQQPTQPGLCRNVQSTNSSGTKWMKMEGWREGAGIHHTHCWI